MQLLKNHPLMKMILLCSLGGSLELFDFMMFIFFIDVFKQVFFPYSSDFVAALQTFAIFMIGYLVRPLGGILFAHFSDRRERKKPFALTLFFMGFPALAIALLPGYSTLGVWSAILLLLLRIMQGLSLGGEFPAAVTIVTEQTTIQQRGLATALLSAAACIGVLLGSAVATLMHQLFSSQQLIAGAWRLPFLLGALLAFLGVYLRQATSASLALQNQITDVVKLPIFIVIRDYYSQVMRAIGMSSVVSFSSFCFLFWPHFLHTYFHYPMKQALLNNVVGLIALVIFIILFGWLSIYCGRIKIYRSAGFALILLSYPLLLLWQIHTEAALFLSYIIFAILFAAVNAVYSGFIAELFPAKVCCTGTALSYNLTTTLVCGTAPLLVTYFCHFVEPLFVMGVGLIGVGLLAIISSYKFFHSQEVGAIAKMRT